jgi:protein-L-isoaspartate(D-aspartate) O-methyltransferase
MTDFATQRRMMVDGQIRPNDITDSRLLAAMQQMPREIFVPVARTDIAYLDLDLPVGEGEMGRRMLKPMVLAKLIQALDLDESDHVLDVGCLTGYSSAILGRLAGSVVALEDDAALAKEARACLNKVGAGNVKVVQGPLAEGFAPDRPYNAILLNGTVEHLPDALCRQLRDGGRLVCVRGHGPAAKATLYLRDQEDIGHRPIFDAAAAILPGFSAPAAFVF